LHLVRCVVVGGFGSVNGNQPLPIHTVGFIEGSGPFGIVLVAAENEKFNEPGHFDRFWDTRFSAFTFKYFLSNWVDPWVF
jgi:hypothetical protein